MKKFFLSKGESVDVTQNRGNGEEVSMTILCEAGRTLLYIPDEFFRAGTEKVLRDEGTVVSDDERRRR